MPRCASGFCKWMNQVSPLTSDLLVSGSSSGPIQVHNQLLLSVLAKSWSSSRLAHFLLFLQYSAILITPDPSFTFTELGDSVFIIAKFHREKFVECDSCRVSRNHSYTFCNIVQWSRRTEDTITILVGGHGLPPVCTSVCFLITSI